MSKWIRTKDKEAEYPCLACDEFGQMWIPTGIAIFKKNDDEIECYDGEHFELDAEKFFAGYDIGNGIKILPRKIIAWMPLPKPYEERKETE